MTPELMAEIKAFVQERDEMLKSGDIDQLFAFHAKHNPDVPPPTRDIAEMSLHKARTAAKSLPMEYRTVSKKWLLDRGFLSMDDGDVA